jgi:hypothetical protein
MTSDELAERLNAKRNGSGWQAKCPAHDDRQPSLSIHQGADGRVLLKCHAGCKFDDIVAALGLTKKDLFTVRLRRLIEKTYSYTDESGNLLFQCVRFLPKGFKQRRQDGNGGWIWNLEGIAPVLFRLPEITKVIREGLSVFICEGEKDVLALVQHGLAATCNPMGAGKWRDSYSETLRGADVIIIADKDEAGREHAQFVASKIYGVAKCVRVIELPDTNQKPVKDAADYFEAGGDTDKLIALADKAPDRTPPDLGLLLQRTADALNQFITFSEDYAVVCAVWVAHTHCIQYFPYTPYVSITSPTKRCGKSNLLTALKYLCARAWYAIAPSVAVLFRKIERDVPTLLLDESDRCLKDAEETKQELLSILNSGYKRGATVDRCGGANKTDLESFHVFCGKAFAGIGELPDTIADRCLSIRMQRQKAGSKHFYEDEVEADLSPIRDGFEKWAASLGDQLYFKIAKTDFPDSLSDRSREACEPLYRIAKLAGGGWFERIKKATAVICAGQEDQDKSVSVLGVVREVYGDLNELSARDLIDGIIEFEHPDCPDWWFKKDVDRAAVGRSLAKILRKFDRKIRTQPMRIEGEVVKAYKRSNLEPIWERYCPPASSPPQSPLSVTTVTPLGKSTQHVTVVTVEPLLEGMKE